jgi:ABC-type branched-subunit amino acid transport system substrate-binding protein
MTLASAFDRSKGFQGGTMRARILVFAVTVALFAVACGNAGSESETKSTIPQNGASTPTSIDPESLKVNNPVDAPGVSDSEINVAVIATKTNNPTGGDFSTVADGVNAYFEMMNASGGIYGRQLKVGNVRDDQFGNNAQAVTASLSNDDAFATFVATTLFGGAQALERANQPTFIWNINPEMTGKNNIFADKGALCFKCATPLTPYLAKELGVTKVGIIAYGVAAQSRDCAEGIENSFKKFPTAEVVFVDKSLGFAAPMAAQVTAMKNRGVGYVGTCIDLNQSFALGKEMQRQGMKAVQSLPNGYDKDFVAKNADVLEDARVNPWFQAFEHEPLIPEQEKLIEWFAKIDKPVTEIGTAGWVLADEFVTGLKLAGPDFDQQKVIDSLNSLTDYTANGLVPPINWTKQHEDPLTNPDARPALYCANSVKVVAGKFESTAKDGAKPFVCFNESDTTVDNPQFLSFAPQ